MEDQIKQLIEDIENDEFENKFTDEFDEDKLIDRLKVIIEKPRYDEIGHIVKECEICGTPETLTVIYDNKLDKVIGRCEKCKPVELKK